MSSESVVESVVISLPTLRDTSKVECGHCPHDVNSHLSSSLVL